MSLSSVSIDPDALGTFPSGAQTTLKHLVKISGIGLFSGAPVVLTIKPAVADHGIVFQRTDRPGVSKIIANLDSVISTPRCTVLGNGVETVHTVEHLLAAFSAMGIDNALIEVDGPEIPILDGSAKPFVDLFLKTGLEELEKPRVYHRLRSPVFYSDNDIHIVALPSEEYRVSYTLQFPSSYGISTQFHSTVVDSKVFLDQIAPARTFSAYEEIAPMIQKGLIKGGSLENAVLIQDGKVLNPEGLRMEGEFVRHKILDVIGDLSLVGVPFLAHIIAIRSGHASNYAFAKLLKNHIKTENA